MRKSLITIFIALVVSSKLLAGDTIDIKKAFFPDPVANFDILIDKNLIDNNLIVVEIGSDLDPKYSILVDYKITSTSTTINVNNDTLVLDNSNQIFQIMVKNFNMVKEKEPLTIEVKIKKDGMIRTYKKDCNLYYIHNVVQIDSFTIQNNTVKYNKKDTIWGVTAANIYLTYSVKLNKEALGILEDIVNPFYNNIIGSSYPPNKNDTIINYYKNIDTIFHQKIELEPGFNKVVYTMYDKKDIDWPFSDSIMFFYVKVDENQQKEFCKTDTNIYLKAFPEGGEFKLAGNIQGIESGIMGNTNVFNPSKASDGFSNINLKYNYRFVLDKKEYFFSDTLQLTVKELPPEFTINGISEVCALQRGIKYDIVSKNANFDPNNYSISWYKNGEKETGEEGSLTVNWDSINRSVIKVEIWDNSTGCGISNEKFVKVGSNIKPDKVPLIDTVGDSQKKNLLLYCNQTDAAEYIWHIPSGTDTTFSNYLMVKQAEGSYWVETMMKNSPGCTAESTPIQYQKGASVSLNEETINVFPNPFSQNLFIEVNDEFDRSSVLSYSIVNKIGEEVIKGEVDDIIKQIDSSKITGGIYILSVTDGKNTISRKIVKL